MKKNILLIGVGGTGSNAVDTFYKKFHELGNQTENKVSALVFDTDAGDLKKITDAKAVVMADSASVGTICDRIGKQYLREWFPCDAKDVRAQEMMRGASQWRKKSYLAFLNLMNKPAARNVFISALEEMVQDPSASCEVYIIASVAGGTGSGSFIPIALYAKRYLRKSLGKDPIVNAMIALPDIYADSQTPENKVKVYSNAYAILRELNAINLVSRNYNASLASKKKAPINFRIGHPDEPNVGVLFDASDKRFWTPEAAPFSQVFLLDRIPGLHSIAAHDMVLANSLYTIICTEIGAAFDSEFSNHELVRSQSNGSNAIYAGISTSQIRFPKDTVLNYLAHKKTLASCDSEWLIIHKATENAIKEKETEAKAIGKRFVMGDSEYAQIVLDTFEQKQAENNDAILSIAERCIDLFDEDGNKLEETYGSKFLEVVDSYIKSRIPAATEVKTSMESSFPDEKIKAKEAIDVFPGIVEDINRKLYDYYVQCFNAIRALPSSTADAVITLNKKKIGTIGDQYSLIKNLLKTKKGANIHPVAALVRLCQFRVALAEKLATPVDEWQELKDRKVSTRISPKVLGSLKDELDIGRSSYVELGKNRFALVLANPENYNPKGGKVANDVEALRSDAEFLANKLYSDAEAFVCARVYTAIAAEVDMLISKYRAFFTRFEKEKETLEELTRDSKRKDAGAIDSVINVYSSIEDKDIIAAIIDEGTGPETESDIIATDDVVGQGVLDSVFASAVAERSEDEHFNDNDSSAYRSIFTKMIDAYKTSIARSEAFRNIASYNAIEAIIASCGEHADSKKIFDKLSEAFSVAQELAKPSLKRENDLSDTDLITPAEIMVFMLSRNTAKYIKKNSDKFGLKLPSDQNSEGAVLRACTEEFVRSYSGNSSARVAIVDSIPDQIFYCTGEVMDITPLCIAKFNELGEDNIYYRHYIDALRRYRIYDTDMWNPHIGNNLFKRGFLPYMNPEMEAACDEKMVKALLYAFTHDLIRYTDGVGATAYGKYYFVCNAKKIMGSDNQPINVKNVSQLLTWLRNENDKIEAWSAAFDSDIAEQKQALPSVLSDNEVAGLEGAITKSRFMVALNEMLYADNSRADGDKSGKKVGPTAAEFAYRIKLCEEIGRDCDDAERILSVLYKVFKEFITFRINPEQNVERFLQVYHQQLVNFYKALASSDVIVKAGVHCKNYFNQIVDWLNSSGLFLDISVNNPLDENGHIAINFLFEYGKEPAIIKILDDIATGKTKKLKTGISNNTGAVEVDNTPVVTEIESEDDSESILPEISEAESETPIV